LARGLRLSHRVFLDSILQCQTDTKKIMRVIPQALHHLIRELSKLPGVGEKTALRYAVGLLKGGDRRLSDLDRALQMVRDEVSLCAKCFYWTEKNACPLCLDPQRSLTQRICVVRDAPDVLALEKFRSHPWKYHILQGFLSPLGGVGPEQLRIPGLIQRLEDERIEELIFAFDATVEGDATALYLRDQIKTLQPQIRITRTAMGIPSGSSVEYLDPSTLENALMHRTHIE
jgi:recombination protein RecR